MKAVRTLDRTSSSLDAVLLKLGHWLIMAFVDGLNILATLEGHGLAWSRCSRKHVMHCQMQCRKPTVHHFHPKDEWPTDVDSRDESERHWRPDDACRAQVGVQALAAMSLLARWWSNDSRWRTVGWRVAVNEASQATRAIVGWENGKPTLRPWCFTLCGGGSRTRAH
jgi:hypothetical protein